MAVSSGIDNQTADSTESNEAQKTFFIQFDEAVYGAREVDETGAPKCPVKLLDVLNNVTSGAMEIVRFPKRQQLILKMRWGFVSFLSLKMPSDENK